MKKNVTGDSGKRTTATSKRTRIARNYKRISGSRNDGGNSGESSTNGNESTTPSGTDSGNVESNRSGIDANSNVESEDNGYRIEIRQSNSSDSGSGSGSGSGSRGNRSGRSVDRSNGIDTDGESKEIPVITSSSDIWDTPKLEFETLFDNAPKKRRGRKPGTKNKTSLDVPGLADGFKFLYSVPTIALGPNHGHWELTDIQATELSTAFLKAVGSSENKNFIKLMHLLEKYVPVLMLISCVYIITAPRIKESMRIIDDANRTKKNFPRVVDFNSGTSTDARTDEDNLGTGNNETNQNIN